MASATKTGSSVVASTSNAANATTRGTVSLGTHLGGILTFKITNGALGPTTECKANVLIAHNGTAPAAGSEGANWKTVYSLAGGIANNAVTPGSYTFGIEVMSIEIEFTGNTGQSVTVESDISVANSIA